MLRSALIVGAGPAAAAVALALTAERGCEVTVIDVGVRLEPEQAAAVERLAASSPDAWAARDVERVTQQPVSAKVRGLPEKRTFGSDYPFRDGGQLAGVRAGSGVNAALVSGALGGFSNVWGAQVMPFPASAFRDWPFSREELRPHYEAVLREIPFAGVDDDLAAGFPLYGAPAPLPRLAPRTARTLQAYERHRRAVNRRGVVVGQARLAVAAARCTPCSLCMTGCPYELIYSARHTLERLSREGRVRYLSGLLAVAVRSTSDEAQVDARELATGRLVTFRAERAFVACGALGSTRLALGSLARFGEDVQMHESRQFVLPALSSRPVADTRDEAEFTLNQFNVVVSTRDCGQDPVAQVHFYPYNPSMAAALPRPLRAGAAAPTRRELFRRLSVGLGYLPSWASPPLHVRASAPAQGAELADITVRGTDVRRLRNETFREVMARLVSVARPLDLMPVLPLVSFAAPAKSYHWGGSFPHQARPADHRNATDVLGRPAGWSRVHLVDASVLPSVAATTFTLTIMANAHRIACAARVL